MHLRSDGYWEYSYQNISPTKYADTVYTMAYLLDSDGNYHYSGLYRYSVDYYVQTIIDYSYTDFIPVAQRMIIYGNKAEAYLATKGN